MLHIHLTILISARWSATSFSFLICNVILRTQLLYYLLLIINDISILVSSGIPVWILASTAASASLSTLTMSPNQQNLSTNSVFALAPISALVQPILVTGFKQPLQINNFSTLDMLSFISLHFLCTHFWQLVRCIELLWRPLPHTPRGHLAAFSIIFWHFPLSFIHIYSHASILHVILPFNNSHGKATLNSLGMAWTQFEPWCIPTSTSEHLLLP